MRESSSHSLPMAGGWCPQQTSGFCCGKCKQPSNDVALREHALIDREAPLLLEGAMIERVQGRGVAGDLGSVVADLVLLAQPMRGVAEQVHSQSGQVAVRLGDEAKQTLDPLGRHPFRA